MPSPRMTAGIVGLLFILAMASSILSGEYLNGIPENGFVSYTNENQSKLKTGAFFLVSLAVAVMSIPLLMYPLLKRYSSTLAKGYIVARAVEGMFDLLMASIPLRLTSLNTMTPVDAENLGSTLLALNNLSSILENIPYCIGALILYYLLYRSRLVPKWLSIWGLIGALLFIATVPIRLFYSVPEWVLIAALPLVINEMVLAVWLIYRGLDRVE